MKFFMKSYLQVVCALSVLGPIGGISLAVYGAVVDSLPGVVAGGVLVWAGVRCAQMMTDMATRAADTVATVLNSMKGTVQ